MLRDVDLPEFVVPGVGEDELLPLGELVTPRGWVGLAGKERRERVQRREREPVRVDRRTERQGGGGGCGGRVAAGHAGGYGCLFCGLHGSGASALCGRVSGSRATLKWSRFVSPLSSPRSLSSPTRQGSLDLSIQSHQSIRPSIAPLPIPGASADLETAVLNDTSP